MLTPVTGIVAEYNPFHRGHLHQLKEARELCDAQAVVAVLSSNFVQRGEPALLDKWTRAEAALACGADLVLELPVVFSSHNAGVFANGAVDILAGTGRVTHLSFGAENPDLLTDNIIDILLEEPKPFKLSLRKFLKEGFSFVEARAKAAEEMLPGAASLLSGSNNTLALAYMMRIRKKQYRIAPLPIQRTGGGYNDATLCAVASATAIRAALRDGNTAAALEALPEASAAILRKARESGRASIGTELFWKLLRALLLRQKPEELASLAEMGEGIEFRLREAALESQSYEEWKNRCSSRRYPAGRVARSAIHILLGLSHWDNRAFQRLGPQWIRPLAMNTTGQRLLREMKKTATLPIISTLGQAARLSPCAAKIAEYEQLACELWEEIIPKGKPGSEHKRKIIIA